MSNSIGLDLIAKERMRQISDEGWTPEHDDEHDDGSLALVAALYATPIKLYSVNKYATGMDIHDPSLVHHTIYSSTDHVQNKKMTVGGEARTMHRTKPQNDSTSSKRAY